MLDFWEISQKSSQRFWVGACKRKCGAEDLLGPVKEKILESKIEDFVPKPKSLTGRLNLKHGRGYTLERH